MIQDGATVQFHYTLTIDGEKVDSSLEGEPMSYVHGQNQIIPGLEEGLAGMGQGESKTVVVPPEKSYGEHDPEAVQTLPKAAFNDPSQLEVGIVVSGRTGEGQEFQARVAAVEAEEVTLDMNHPLAGKTLNFDVEVVEVS